MRVLFCSHPAVGHFLPLVQLAWAFRTNGHEVIVAIAEHPELVANSGLEVVNVAPDFDITAIFASAAQEFPEFMKPVDPKAALNLEEWGGPLAAVNRPLIPKTIELVDEWRPDLIVYDQGTTAGLFAAARRGIPAVQRNMSAWRTNEMHAAVASHLTDLSERYEITVGKPDVIVESFPPSLIVDDEPEGWFMRWVPYGKGGVLGDRLPPPPDRPRVAISMGTTELQSFGVGALDPIITAASELDAEFVLAIGDIDIGPLGTLPSNVRFVGWMPLQALLRTSTAIIHHGGGGTALTAIDAGIPQLLAPHPRDAWQRTTWNSVRKRGVGLVSVPDDVDAALLTRLLSDQDIRTATEEVRAELVALPSPADVVRQIIEQFS